MENSGTHTSHSYRGLVLQMHVYRVAVTEGLLSQIVAWGYEVSVREADGDGGAHVWGPKAHTSPYLSHEAAERACIQRGRIAVDLLLEGI
ncbi:hypothetical protein [Cupriavidus pauculus]|uniref:hypothetical protein n=1 Tax=Cupriavidus pauculus TaxID=82633 RepID=UPI0012451B2C|nr:hypothetical protein [Cupriavidus pauculus]KAB0603511.1 hypothetical protein F7R19_08405 [Cupriavidus pauculus]MCM3605763.1 hypothetical protein [Cupriavidus pauculus]UAL02275.1 hypothetical protein K8O84_26200 [Cupriavidus pauculus]